MFEGQPLLKLEYWLNLLYGSQVEEVAKEVDRLFLDVLKIVVGSPLHHQPGLLTCACRNTVKGLDMSILGLDGRIFQSLTMQLSNKLKGLGVRSQHFISPFAYYGALRQSLPHFSSVCLALQNIFGEENGDYQRCTQLLASGCLTCTELEDCCI